MEKKQRFIDRTRAAMKRMEAAPSANQTKYIEDLLNAAGFSTRVQRNAYLSRIFRADIRFIDDLTTSEASELIELLLERVNLARREQGMASIADSDD